MIKMGIDFLKNEANILFVSALIPAAIVAILQLSELFTFTKKSDSALTVRIDVEHKEKIASKLKDGQHEYVFFIDKIDRLNGFRAFFARYSKKYIKIDKNVYEKSLKSYHFKTSKEIHSQIQELIRIPLKSIKDDTLLIQFDEAIHYSLSHLSMFCKTQEDIKDSIKPAGDRLEVISAKASNALDLHKEVQIVGKLISEIKTFADEIDRKANEKTEQFINIGMNNILDKHHMNMEQLTLQVKIFNHQHKNNQKSVDLLEITEGENKNER